MTQNTKVFSKILGRNCTRVTFVAVNKNFSQQKLEITKRPLALKKKNKNHNKQRLLVCKLCLVVRIALW